MHDFGPLKMATAEAKRRADAMTPTEKTLEEAVARVFASCADAQDAEPGKWAWQQFEHEASRAIAAVREYDLRLAPYDLVQWVKDWQLEILGGVREWEGTDPLEVEIHMFYKERLPYFNALVARLEEDARLTQALAESEAEKERLRGLLQRHHDQADYIEGYSGSVFKRRTEAALTPQKETT